jgi:hypothetical protein
MLARTNPDTGCPEAVREQIAKLGGELAGWLKRRGMNPVDVRAQELLGDAVGELERLADQCDTADREARRQPLSQFPMDADIRESFREQGRFMRSTGAGEVLR